MDSAVSFEHAFRLHQQGRLQEAFAAYESLLQRQPAHAEALHFSGLLLHQAGQSAAGAERIEQSLRIEARTPDPWCNLGAIYQSLNRLDDAVAALRQALQRDPQLGEIWSNLAGVYIDMHNAPEAEAASRRAVAIRPDHLHAWFNLALSLEAQGKLAEALEIVSTLVQQAPAELAPAGLKASLEQALGKLDAARGTLSAAIAHHPGEARLHLQLARVEEQATALPAAAAAYEQALRLAPDDGAVLSDLLYLRKRMADWHDLAMLRERFRAGVAAGQAGLSPFNLLSGPSTRAEQRRCAERWSALLPMRPAAPQRQPVSSGRLRIGYLSSDFYQHATAFLTAGLFEHHDRTRFEVFGYSTGRDDGSAMRARLIKGFDRFIDARGWPAERIAAQIRADGIDILVDLKGHTEAAPTAVLALRPAAIQVNYLGYPGSMGADFMDYLIGDAVVTPFGHAADYSETIVQLPHSYQINDSKRPIAAARSRRELSLPENAAVFCCFNSTYKLNPAVFDAWARILAAVPDSVLWLLARGEDDAAVGSLRREAAVRGIAPARLVFAGYRANADYLTLYRCADLFLDTWPYNAHTTASDALWAGCPVLTWLGDTFAGRVAASLLHAVGLPELVMDDVEQYVARAIELGRNRELLAPMRHHLANAGRASPLFDTAATTRALERAFETMAAQRRGGTRSPFRVDR